MVALIYSDEFAGYRMTNPKKNIKKPEQMTGDRSTKVVKLLSNNTLAASYHVQK
jgi:hypothetical protein